MSTIITKNSATPGSTPVSLVQGELAINVAEGRLFFGSGSGNVVKEFLTASYALTASYLNPLHQDVVITGSLFLTSTSNNIFLIKNQTNTPVLIISQSGVIVLSTQSINLTDPAPNGGIYFTSGAFYVGLD